MSPKEYLYRIRNLKLEVEATKNELLELKASMDGVRAIDTTKDHVDGGKPVDMADVMGRIEAVKEKTDTAAQRAYDRTGQGQGNHRLHARIEVGQLLPVRFKGTVPAGKKLGNDRSGYELRIQECSVPTRKGASGVRKNLS